MAEEEQEEQEEQQEDENKRIRPRERALGQKKPFRHPCVVPRDKDVIFRMRASLLYRPAKALCSKSKLGSYFSFDKSNIVNR